MRIIEHLSVAELERRYRAAQDVTEARHTQAIWLLAQGRTVLDVAGVLAFAPRWVEQLAARHDAHGPGVLGDQRRRNGRAASVLTERVLAALAERLKTPPDDGGRWTGPKVALWMARQLGVERVHPQRGWAEAPKGSASPKGWWKGAGGGAAAGAVVAPDTPSAAPALGHPRAAGRVQGGLAAAVAQARAAHPDRPVEVWAEDEHRLGLKPVRRRVWAPVGARPIALGHHRYKWLHVSAFVQPTTGEAVWFLSNGLSKPFFAALLAAFARELGAGRERHVVLVLDNAGWHGPKGLVVPDGVTLVFLPPHSPELQPAERLWPLVDEPVANRHFATLDDLDAVVAERCRRLDPPMIKPHTHFHWWPNSVQPS
jgi:hypothetical protein